MTPSQILCELIAIPSVNPMGRKLEGPIYFEHRLSDWLVEYFESIGVAHERIEVAPGRANILARYDSPGAQRTLLLDAHQDTVPVDGMTIPPFEPRIADGRITGRGASDVKGGMAAMLHAFTRLVKEKPGGAANVVLSCSCDEESTTIGIRDLVSYWEPGNGKSKLLANRPDGAIVAEPTDLDVVIAHRGVTRFRVHTLGRACHSSDPSQGRNAIYLMAKVIAYLEHAAAVLPKFLPPHPLCGQPTLSVGRIYGGQSVNIVPDRCTIEIDRRLIPTEDPTVVWTKMKDELILRFGEHVQVDEAWIGSPALDNRDNAWLADMLLKAIPASAGKHVTKGVLYGTHASTISCAGVPAVVFGPGSIAQAHTADEYIEIAELDYAAEVYFNAISR
jgi:succinyl-diaminopimelate desuccinylase